MHSGFLGKQKIGKAKTQKAGKKAFTLAETIVCISILGIVAVFMGDFLSSTAKAMSRTTVFVENEVSISSLVDDFKGVSSEEELLILYDKYTDIITADPDVFPRASVERVEEFSGVDVECYKLHITKSEKGTKDLIAIHNFRVK